MTTENTENSGTSTTPEGTTAPAGTTTTTTTAVDTASTDFIAGLPDDLKNEPCLSNFKGKDAVEVVKAYVHAQKELGNKIRIPGPDASDEVKKEFLSKVTAVPGVIKMPDVNNPEEVSAFYTALGRPEKAEGYVVKIPDALAKDIENNPALSEKVGKMTAEFKELAFKLGLTAAQAEALVANDVNSAILQRDAMIAERDAAKATLKEVWGNEYDNNLQLSEVLLKKYSEQYPDATQALLTGEAARNPVFMIMAAQLARQLKESGVIVGNREVTYGHNPAEARAQISEITLNKSHPYHNTRHPDHAKAVEKMAALYEAAYPSVKQ